MLVCLQRVMHIDRGMYWPYEGMAQLKGRVFLQPFAACTQIQMHNRACATTNGQCKEAQTYFMASAAELKP